MTQSPVTVTYSLEEVLGQIIQKLDRLDNKVEDLSKGVNHKLGDLRQDMDGKFERLQKDVDGKFERLQKDVDAKFDQVQLKFEHLQKDVDAKFDQVQLKFEHLQENIVDLKVGQSRMEAEIKGIGKRLDTQEFINRSVVVGFVLALAAGAVKLFFPGSLN